MYNVGKCNLFYCTFIFIITRGYSTTVIVSWLALLELYIISSIINDISPRPIVLPLIHGDLQFAIKPKSIYNENQKFQLICTSETKIEVTLNEKKIENVLGDSILIDKYLNSDGLYILNITIKRMNGSYAGRYKCSNANSNISEYVFVATSSSKVFVPFSKKNYSYSAYLNTIVKIPCTPVNNNTIMSITNFAGTKTIKNLEIDKTRGISFNYTDKKLIETINFLKCVGTLNGKTSILLFYFKEKDRLDPNIDIILPHLNVYNGSLVPTRIVGESITFMCISFTPQREHNTFSWLFPWNSSRVDVHNLAPRITIGDVISDDHHELLKINDLRRNDTGTYKCYLRRGKKELHQSIELEVRDKHFLYMRNDEKYRKNHQKSGGYFKFILSVETSYDIVLFVWYKDNVRLEDPDSRWFVSVKEFRGYGFDLEIPSVRLEDAGVYHMKFYARVRGNEQPRYVGMSNKYSFAVFMKPTVEFRLSKDARIVKFYQAKKKLYMKCKTTGIPSPEVLWTFSKCQNTSCATNKNSYKNIRGMINTQYEVSNSKEIWIVAHESGTYKCDARNSAGTSFATTEFYVTDIEGDDKGFGLVNETARIYYPIIGSSFVIICFSNKLLYKPPTFNIEDLTKLSPPPAANHVLKSYSTDYSYLVELKINSVHASDSKRYVCNSIANEGRIVQRKFILSPILSKPPKFVMKPKEKIHISNQSDKIIEYRIRGNPPPLISFYFNGAQINTSMPSYVITRTKDKVVLQLRNFSMSGILTARLMNFGGMIEYNVTIVIDKASIEPVLQPGLSSPLIIFICFIILFLILAAFLVLYMFWMRNNKKNLKILAAGREFDPLMRGGNTEGILNPDISIFEQTDHIGYDESLEFPKSQLTLGQVIGNGHYGIVYQGFATNIANIKGTVKVAVKQPKIKNDLEQKKSLISELKILIHIGRHLNILNLMGAITLKDDLNVIVVYCELGSLESYMRYAMQAGNYFDDDSPIDMFGYNEDHSRRNCRKCNINENTCPIHCDGAAAVMSSSEESAAIKNDPITKRLLHIFAYQIARGMEYLSNKNFIHRDLAARNVLLTSERIVKICDFGLSRNLYGNTVYEKKSSMQLPLKWMALESITHNTYTVKSDVWSFGVTLYEIYSLGGKPYSKIYRADIDVLSYLLEGSRLEKPQYANDTIYCIMKQCWEKDAKDRPTFSQLKIGFSELLDHSEIQYFEDLDGDYKDIEQPPDYRVIQANHSPLPMGSVGGASCRTSEPDDIDLAKEQNHANNIKENTDKCSDNAIEMQSLLNKRVSATRKVFER